MKGERIERQSRTDRIFEIVRNSLGGSYSDELKSTIKYRASRYSIYSNSYRVARAILMEIKQQLKEE